MSGEWVGAKRGFASWTKRSAAAYYGSTLQFFGQSRECDPTRRTCERSFASCPRVSEIERRVAGVEIQWFLFFAANKNKNWRKSVFLFVENREKKIASEISAACRVCANGEEYSPPRRNTSLDRVRFSSAVKKSAVLKIKISRKWRQLVCEHAALVAAGKQKNQEDFAFSWGRSFNEMWKIIAKKKKGKPNRPKRKENLVFPILLFNGNQRNPTPPRWMKLSISIIRICSR